MSSLHMSHMFHPYMLLELLPSQCQQWLMSLSNPQIAAHTSYVPYLVYNTQPQYNPPRAPAYQNPPRPYVHVQAPIHQNRPVYAPRPCPNLEARNAHTYTPIAELYA
ncbi:hypothetical protein H5410_042002 [Solanum commersonii]|uniref:Uncharacterized protein n=1 Tax=Solanum commersonii TaxID=4109 RepID=A0A9J5XWA7_SOLCO|nr:hypothetical protein H5410_042002 [Solanum commersonii]